MTDRVVDDGNPTAGSVPVPPDLPVAVPAIHWGNSGGSCTCSGHARPGEPAVFDRSRCPIHGPNAQPVAAPDHAAEK
jgi:hypothetical protein